MEVMGGGDGVCVTNSSSRTTNRGKVFLEAHSITTSVM